MGSKGIILWINPYVNTSPCYTNSMTKVPKNLPDKPGVYFFKKGSKTLYIGKAASLRSRVRSYFSNDIVFKRSAAIGKMVLEATKVDYKVTDSVLEALILEAELIKKHKPYYNVREKDDRSFNFVVITDEEYPRVLVMRGKKLLLKYIEQPPTLLTYGPFPHGAELREALKIIRRIFPYRDKCLPGVGKLCFNAQIGLCPGVCVGAMSRKEYLRYIRNIELFFKGKKSKIVRDFTRQMKRVAKIQDFEKAASLRNKIFALKHLNDVALLKRNLRSDLSGSPRSNLGVLRIEAYDIAHIGGAYGVGAMSVLVDGEVDKNEYRKFKLRGVYANHVNDTKNLKEVL